ncbi:hypothetical protein LCGC14_0671330 [marine sediment metagenome]|uniref:DUF4124 domain-containing protein n=1 Tax=marine sediment metagenome TaxID=412755 RepID=A0A0F9TYZ5_9ZZZZ
MRNVFIVLIVVFAASVALAGGSTVVFKYVDSSGTLSFTDDENRVPEMYKAKAEKATLGELEDYDRFTPVGLSTETPRLVTLRAANTPVTVTEQDCGTVITRSERRDHDGLNSLFWVVEDDCGELYNATGYPRPYFELRR